jgi:hypothetical protein
MVLAAFPREEGGFTSKRSRDGGRTWYEAPDWPTWCAYQFPDGELIHVSAAQLLPNGERVYLKRVGDGVYETVLYRSLDHGHTYQKETARLLGVPEIGQYAEGAGQPLFSYVDHSIVALRDGSLLAGALGTFAVDRPGTQRSYVVRSTDRGRTWNYVSTVAFDLHEGDARRRVGFTEPYLQTLPNGDILCFMRTGGAYGGKHWPLYMSRSNDDGKTWSHADPIADRGVMPKSVLMSNGVLALIYGRPGDWLAFSTDLGHTWVGHFCLHQGPMHYDCSYYDAIEEVGPDTLLAAYGRTDPNNCRLAELLGTFITVRRT